MFNIKFEIIRPSQFFSHLFNVQTEWIPDSLLMGFHSRVESPCHVAGQVPEGPVSRTELARQSPPLEKHLSDTFSETARCSWLRAS